MKSDRVRFAVVGARRGKTFVQSALSLSDRMQLVAMCDCSEAALVPWRSQPTVKCYTDFQEVLDDPGVDAVCIATPAPLHARQSIAALQAGKHVLSEVIATYSLEEGRELIRAVEESGKTYMMAENYCFMRDVLMIQNMVELGIFGEITYASGSYIHDCRSLFFDKDGDLTWRGRLRRDWVGNSYPTHGLGPVCRWLGINQTDVLKTTAAWQSRGGAMSRYVNRNLPNRAEYADAAGWAHPDTVTSLIHTRNGVLIESRNDWASARPHHMTRYELQGTRAAFSASADPALEPLVWIEGRSPQKKNGTAESWEPLFKYAPEFEHPLWREHAGEAETAGHGGGDFFVLREFLSAIEEGRKPLFDVYDAVTWSSIAPLSVLSIARGNVPVEVPDFRGETQLRSNLKGFTAIPQRG